MHPSDVIEVMDSDAQAEEKDSPYNARGKDARAGHHVLDGDPPGGEGLLFNMFEFWE